MSDALDQVGLIDSHCHLQQLDADPRERALDRARERGVRGFLVPAIRLEDADTLFDLAERHDDVWIALGVHPHEARHWRAGDQTRLRGLLDHPRVVAVGECGLDFHYDHSPREVQRTAMREQWEVAVEVDLPVIVHNRDSDESMMEIFRSDDFRRLRGVFHSFCATVEMARELIASDRVCLGISGMVTFRAAENVRDVVRAAPLERMLVETDTPFLAPVPYRGKPNEPGWVVEVAERVAQVLDLEVARIHEVTGRAFAKLFDRARLTPSP